jgi:hypothetical protein
MTLRLPVEINGAKKHKIMIIRILIFYFENTSQTKINKMI